VIETAIYIIVKIIAAYLAAVAILVMIHIAGWIIAGPVLLGAYIWERVRK
jgi:4-hydroxybenzoate polyprenyltransferase